MSSESLKVSGNNNEQNSNNKLETLNEKLPFIKFPADFEVKLTLDSNEQSPLHFLVKKEGALNNVSVTVSTGSFGKEIPKWEVLAFDTNGDPNDSPWHVSLDDTQGLIKAIEEALHHKEIGSDFNNQDIDQK